MTDSPVLAGEQQAGGEGDTAAVAVALGIDRNFGAAVRSAARARALETALMKQAKGVPFYTVPEAAVLLGWSQEHLYRLVRGDVFPAVRSGTKYSVPARAVNELVQASMRSGSCLDIEEWAGDWKSARSDGAGGAA